MPLDRSEFKNIGKEVVIYEPVVMAMPHVISIGNHVIISEFVWMIGGNGIIIGSHIHIAPYCCISGGGETIIEDFVGICAGTKIISGTEDINAGMLTNPTIPKEFRAVIRSKIHIKEHAFLGSNAIVMPGVTIGEGAVLGAGSVATKDLDPWTIYLGSPAKPIKQRNKGQILEFADKVRKNV